MSAPDARATLVDAPCGAPFALTNKGTLGIVFKPCRTAAGMYGDVAQLGERCLRTAEVAGSTPVVSTKQTMSRRTRLPVAPRLICGALPRSGRRSGG
jgi:hypothetical protein